ncbi:TPA: hypothetical protein HH295_20410 [Xanthomonas vasicola pv. zeae]|uniref:Metalloprotease TldD/E N-terminal domain-containing protein n=1 Tax=Xanthomonas vasicola pv. vasculorum TaxID=325776 RepID=A0AAE8F9D7_XANVA|nr:hypothetical protein C7V42_00355 [Xanthomonas vasicola pv. vasculorum]AZR29252.1 hypothetical protein KWO_000390 [Xanthomonas vasicola pv. musacearum NCPPB 4379]AZR33205.1 hypothetical protein NX08_000360 [Xanthomonas vasicola]KFA10948.1 hypothetical protein KWM_0107670 [Xanthomonas vasicola pv. musacearum NCPPB 2005]KFA15783.1 hypothetical protein KWQ_0100980 [Xanthomonas vasicola pv. musacearum NCPPB 4380]KFA17091.1 hypothetical protein A11G_0115670 [Xanthomonas vasicola pv. musacearum NC
MITREAQVVNVVNAESSGVGVRVLADGAWGCAATNTLTSDGVGTATLQAVAIAKANARLDGAPVQLAPVTPARQVSWKTPIKKNVNEFRKARLQMAFSWTK